MLYNYRLCTLNWMTSADVVLSSSVDDSRIRGTSLVTLISQSSSSISHSNGLHAYWMAMTVTGYTINSKTTVTVRLQREHRWRERLIALQPANPTEGLETAPWIATHQRQNRTFPATIALAVADIVHQPAQRRQTPCRKPPL